MMHWLKFLPCLIFAVLALWMYIASRRSGPTAVDAALNGALIFVAFFFVALALVAGLMAWWL